MRTQTLLTLAVLVTMTGVAAGQPKLVITNLSGGADVSSNGNTVAGWLYDGANQKNVMFTWTRGSGYHQVPCVTPYHGGGISCSADGSVLATNMDNVNDWGSLNCFAGYDAAGAPKVVPNPCSIGTPSMASRYTAGTGWVNAPSFPRYVDPVTGRMVGGTRCDYTINTANDLSADGRYIVGGAYWTGAFNSAGNPSLGFCGDFFAFRYDSQTGEFLKLDTTSHTTRADYVNGDGSVILGYDLGGVTNRLTVWYNGAETILDPGPGYYKGGAVAGNGTAVAAGCSPAFGNSHFGWNDISLVKWNRVGSVWTPQNLGMPANWIDGNGDENAANAIIVRGMSDDGNTIVGIAFYGGDYAQYTGVQRPFIWKAGMNEDAPLDLAAYLTTLDPGGTALAGMRITEVAGLSGDGNTLHVFVSDTRSYCPAPAVTDPSNFFGALLSLSGAGQAVEPAAIVIQPVDYRTRCVFPGMGAFLSVRAGGSWPLNYQWQREDPNAPNTWINLSNSCAYYSPQPNVLALPADGSWDYEGVNGPALRINDYNYGSGRTGRYRVVVSNANGNVTSAPATFEFLPPPVPQSLGVAMGCTNAPASFTIGAIPGLDHDGYRWKVNTDPAQGTWAYVLDGTNTFPQLGGSFVASGALTNTLTITPLTLPSTQTYDFMCHFTAGCVAYDSDIGTLTVLHSCGRADIGGQGGVPIACGDGVLDNNDFVVYINDFFDELPSADLGVQGGFEGHDGMYDNNDFIVFINYFFTGCN